MNTLGKAGLVFALGGLAGWGLENILSQRARYSRAFVGLRVPFLPVYGLGALGVAAVAPVLQVAPWPLRAAAYAGGLAALELAACRMDRALAARRIPRADQPKLEDGSWDYGDGPGTAGEGCVDIPHALAWGGLGLVAEQIIKSLSSQSEATLLPREHGVRSGRSLRPRGLET